MSASPAVRSLRAAVFAALCVLLGAGGHTLATGMAPPVWTQVMAFVPICGAGYLLAGRERSLAAIGGGTLTAQGGLHLVFDAVRPHARMVMHGMRMSSTHALIPHATAAHVGAALVLTWWLRRGEAALWLLLRRVAALVPGLLAWWLVSGGRPLVPDDGTAVRPRGAEPWPVRRVLLRYMVQRRGPPGTRYPI
ncbi:hypothetical protein AB0F77_20335 [Streptomyces sp. NPDC026672]|uniref:hypothetical protein n=1 Tax=unclassified Streptomyces TaxID=2593676 RepID=UPI0033FE08BC